MTNWLPPWGKSKYLPIVFWHHRSCCPSTLTSQIQTQTDLQCILSETVTKKKLNMDNVDGSPKMLETRDELEELIDSYGGREEMWKKEKKLEQFFDDHSEKDIEKLQAEEGTTSSTNNNKLEETFPIQHPIIEYVILDLDSYEYQVLEFLQKTRQTVLIYRLEIAQHFPPPYKYAMLYHPEKVKLYRKHMKYAEDMYFSPLYGMSLSAAISVLKDTHYLLYLTDKTDAVFVHKLLKPYLDKAFGIDFKLPLSNAHMSGSGKLELVMLTLVSKKICIA